jgi:hypothetical protein
MFEGFATFELETERGAIHARVGGSGPPLLLLHGYPETRCGPGPTTALRWCTGTGASSPSRLRSPSG